MNNLQAQQKTIPISINHRNPFFAIQTSFDKALESFYKNFNGFDLPKFTTDEFENQAICPAIDIVDDKDHFKVEAEMPGMGEENIQVSIEDNILTIKGEKQTSKQDSKKNYLMREISYGAYERSIRLPDSADIDKAKASFKKGMLWVDIPKKIESIKQSKKIKVETA